MLHYNLIMVYNRKQFTSRLLVTGTVKSVLRGHLWEKDNLDS